MKYIKAYFGALFWIGSTLSTVYLVGSIRSDYSPIPAYILYVSLVAAVAGPLKVLISKTNTIK